MHARTAAPRGLSWAAAASRRGAAWAPRRGRRRGCRAGTPAGGGGAGRGGGGGRGRRGRPRVQSERVHFETCQERPGLMAAGARGKVRQAKVWGHHHRDSERSHLGRQGHPGKEETKGTPTLQRGAGRKRPATAEEPQRRDEGAPTGLAGAGGAAVPRGQPEGPQDQEPQQGGTSAGGCRGHSKAPGVRPTGDSRGRTAIPAPSALGPGAPTRPRRGLTTRASFSKS